VSLTGNGSETNGTIVSTYWTQVSGPSTAGFADPSQAYTQVSGLVEGVYVFELTIKDNSGKTATDQVQVTVNAAPVTPPVGPANQAPIADAGADITVEQSAAPVSLDGSASYDPDGTIVKYQWIQVAGMSGVTVTNAGSAKPAAYGMNPGSYTFRLTVTDDKGATGNDEVTVTVNAAPAVPVVPAAPVASAGAPVDTVKLPANQVSLDGSSSSGNIVSYQWVQVSGPSAAVVGDGSAASTTATKLIAGTYVFQLTVKDNNGVTATTLVKVVVLNDVTRTAAPVKNVELYPNPARDLLNVKYESAVQEKVSMTIYTSGGVRVLSADFEKGSGATSFQLNVSGLGKGVYGLKIVGGGGGKEMRMFVKQ
ncbi:MAG TPA: PKD domain-containing protein, partial [Puia sp.]